MQVVQYTIPVRGAATSRLTVDLTGHGPIMTQAGQNTSVDWMGNVPSPDLAAMLAVNQAASFSQFKAVLAGWYARAASRGCRSLLATWNATMAADSAAASAWWTFWRDYLSAVFQPWWNQAKVPIGQDHEGLAVSAPPRQTRRIPARPTQG